MAFNNLYCLSRPQVHTLSVGASCPEDFGEHIRSLENYEKAGLVMAPIEARLREEMTQVLGAEWCDRWTQGLPEYVDVPNEVNMVEILRLWTYAKSLDIVDWGKNAIQPAGQCRALVSRTNVSHLPSEADQWLPLAGGSPFRSYSAILQEAHDMLYEKPVQRLSQSD